MFTSTFEKLSDALTLIAQEAKVEAERAAFDRDYEEADEAEGETRACLEALEQFALVNKGVTEEKSYKELLTKLQGHYDFANDVVEPFRGWLDEEPEVPTQEITAILAKIAATAPIRIRRCMAEEPEPTALSNEKKLQRKKDTAAYIKESGLLPQGCHIRFHYYRRPYVVIWDSEAVRARF